MINKLNIKWKILYHENRKPLPIGTKVPYRKRLMMKKEKLLVAKFRFSQ